MDLREIGREDVGWIHLAQDRDQWLAVEVVRNVLSSCVTVSLTGKTVSWSSLVR
jgi:hypothetical protein